MTAKTNDNLTKKPSKSVEPDRGELLKIEKMLKENPDLEDIAKKLLTESAKDMNIMKKDSLDRLLDIILVKIKTGNYFIPNLAYPTKKISDQVFEDKIIKLINIYLYPDIVPRLLRYFSRNINDADKNLFLANLITSDEIIKEIYNTFLMFRSDIDKAGKERTFNVKRIQQFPITSEDKLSSPLDATCRFKYILEFIALRQNVKHIYSLEDIKLAKDRL